MTSRVGLSSGNPHDALDAVMRFFRSGQMVNWDWMQRARAASTIAITYKEVGKRGLKMNRICLYCYKLAKLLKELGLNAYTADKLKHVAQAMASWARTEYRETRKEKNLFVYFGYVFREFTMFNKEYCTIFVSDQRRNSRTGYVS